MADEYIGRRESVGLGIEATAGTAVAPQVWVRHLSNSFQKQVTRIENESAMGRVERLNDSAIDQEWSEGTLEGKVGDVSIGYLLYNVFGSVTTTDNADSNAAVKDHTFNVAQSNVPKYLTVAVKNPVEDQRYSMGTVDELQISWEAGEWVRFSANMKARAGETAENTVAYVSETEFRSKDVSFKLAENVAGLSSATGLAVRSGNITIGRASEPYFAVGSTSPVAMTSGVFEVTGEFVLRYTDTDLQEDWLNNAVKAMSLSFENSTVTIGAAAHPSLTFTAPQTRLSTFDKSNDLDSVIEATVGFSCELSVSDAYALRAVLTNTVSAYEAA